VQPPEFQHLVLLAGEVHAGAVHLHHLGVEVDDEVAGLDHRLGVAIGTAHDGVNARSQLVVGAVAEAADLVLDTGKTGQDQNGVFTRSTLPPVA
jgi:hypothetical protein